MSQPGATRGGGLAVRTGLVVAATAAGAALAPEALGRPGVVAAALALGALAAVALLRPYANLVRGLSAALTSYRENDFSVRLVDVPALQGLVAQFNALGETLRRDRSTVYQKELMLELVLEAATFAVVLCDEQDTVVLANSAARELFNQGRPAVGMPFAPLLERVFPPGALEAGGGEGALVTLSRGQATEVFHASSRYFELNAERHTLHLFKSMTREVARQEVEVWKRTMRVVSHEVDNSLGPVMSLVDSARAILGRPEHLHRLEPVLETIGERAASLRRFLEGYARLARLPAPRPRPVPWGELVEGLRPLYPFRLAGPLPEEPGHLDPVQLQQVLLNLLKNAVEAGGPPEAIELEVRPRPGGGAELRVLDRGAGLGDEALARSTSLFFTTKPGGSGLGLALSREIVEAHGGQLTLARREGGGAVAQVVLPGPPAPGQP